MSDYMSAGMALNSPSDPNHPSFLQQLQEMQALSGEPMALNIEGGVPAAYDANADASSKNRNRGNYRCSKCGEPKKGHVCPLVPTVSKCSRCGLSKKACTCGAPETRSIGIQVEMDEDMTTRVLDLSVQGIMDMHTGFPSPPSSAYASPVSYASPPRSFQ
ncbi:hypothetical protein PINS_up000665 [Pythium insidiosum]|nr:hypothetical protein PINS_up000665 [Pythium insidiosum]